MLSFASRPVQFLRIALLHHAALSAPVLLGPYDAGDLEADVEHWLTALDRPAAESGFWEHRFFVPSLIAAWEGWVEQRPSLEGVSAGSLGLQRPRYRSTAAARAAGSSSGA
ncbi:hypothetical protein GCM10010193_03590 [Kitasatospora atroaurantiaca]|uniref:Uncharacterized protein n=1 Tax=Kitasatospora atroaurantiaca TaxID=285545 RepID=A0A561ELT1_9ACTN|nr:hypothetical protein [Kitasatospora atroaurantiaca]TWE16577.1 hypothetical protein FB465_1560 [Kitasatospora atroaurantiaca]